MARALIVGCGCRGTVLGAALSGRGWMVRGSSRETAGAARIEASGIEPAVADPDRVGTLLEHVGDVTLVYWLMGSAVGEAEVIAALHGPRLERFCERLVDTPVRGVVYEAAGTVQAHHTERGASIVEAVGGWLRIPVAVVDEDPGEHGPWAAAMVSSGERLLAAR